MGLRLPLDSLLWGPKLNASHSTRAILLPQATRFREEFGEVRAVMWSL